MRSRILAELDRLESEHRVRVLLAVESGSRAWGFASPDSDYDVRFVYAHSADWYLSVFEQSDVIEEMLPGDLDVSGWDLRKTLRLFSRCNLALNEWLGSPIVYKEMDFRSALAAEIPNYFHPVKATHHYRSMAARSFSASLMEGEIPIKKLFYVLRPLLACRLIQQTGTQPPTAFLELLNCEWVTPEERIWITDLLQRKVNMVEAEAISIEPERVQSLEVEIESYVDVELPPTPPHRAQVLDDLFRTWICAS